MKKETILDIIATFRARIASAAGVTPDDLAYLDAIPRFATGGTVPGPVGAPVLAVVHGGEEVVPVGGGGSGVTFQFMGGAPVNPIEAGHLAARTYRVHMQMAGR